jgi:hypothetical protein
MTEASVPAGGDGAEVDATAIDATQADSGRPATPLWLAVTIAVLFGVLYAYDVWEAVDSLVQLSVTAASIGTSLTPVGTALLVVAVLLPLLIYGAVSWLGHRRGPVKQILLFLVGYALVQVFMADLGEFIDLGIFATAL